MDKGHELIFLEISHTTDTWKDAQKSLVIREMQIKTTIRYHFIPVRMSIIKKIRHSKCWHGYGEKRTLVHSWWDCKLAQPLGKIIWRFFKKLKTNLLRDPAVPLKWVYSKELETLTCKRHVRLCVHSSVIYNSQDMEATSTSINR